MCLGFKPGAAGWNVPTNPLTAVPQTIILFEIFFKMGQIVLTLFTHQSLLETLFRFHWIKFRSKCKNISRQKCNKNFYWIFKFRQFSQKCKNFEDAPPPSKKNSNIFWQNSKNGFFFEFFTLFLRFRTSSEFQYDQIRRNFATLAIFLKFSSNFVYGLFSIWQTFAPTLAFLYGWTYYHSCYCQRLNSHLVTLLQTKGGFNAFAAVIRYLRTSYEM